MANNVKARGVVPSGFSGLADLADFDREPGFDFQIGFVAQFFHSAPYVHYEYPS